jgi:hypothetical protein
MALRLRAAHLEAGRAGREAREAAPGGERGAARRLCPVLLQHVQNRPRQQLQARRQHAPLPRPAGRQHDPAAQRLGGQLGRRGVGEGERVLDDLRRRRGRGRGAGGCRRGRRRAPARAAAGGPGRRRMGRGRSASRARAAGLYAAHVQQLLSQPPVGGQVGAQQRGVRAPLLRGGHRRLHHGVEAGVAGGQALERGHRTLDVRQPAALRQRQLHLVLQPERLVARHQLLHQAGDAGGGGAAVGVARLRRGV